MIGSEFLLARLYFTLAITFHIIFPAINIGLSMIIFFLECAWLKTKEEKYLKLTKFWMKIFAMLFGVGVVTGITMSFMFGLTFSKFIDIGGNIIGPILSFEVLTAFFLEASFLGVMLFGWERVGKKFHLFSTFCVSFGTLISAFWILSANSFMQTPAGAVLKDGILQVESWKKVIFNPSFGSRFLHMITGSVITGSLFVLGISFYLIKKNKDLNEARTGAKIASILLLISSLMQLYFGDSHGLNTMKYQPAKIAALEGHWENEEGSQPIILFGIPNSETEKNDYEIKIPYLGSIILTHSLNGKIPALKDIPKEERPPVAIPFYCFRIMVGLGLLFILIGVWATFATRKEFFASSKSKNITLREKINRFMMDLTILSTPLGAVAVICGWYVTEVGRQPWVVYGLLKSKDALTPNLDPASVLFGICFSGLLYIAISVILIIYLKDIIKKGINVVEGH